MKTWGLFDGKPNDVIFNIRRTTVIRTISRSQGGWSNVVLFLRGNVVTLVPNRSDEILLWVDEVGISGKISFFTVFCFI